MFEWLQGTNIGGDEYIKGYNSESQKFIIEDEEGKELKEINIFDTGISFNIHNYDNWQEKLHNRLIRDGKAIIYILSTESGDSYPIEIYRHKTLLPTDEYLDNVILTNYVIMFAEEVKGKILTRHHKRYGGCAIDELREFTEWIDEQEEQVSEFNNTDMWNTFDAIVCSDFLCTQEEYNILWDMFNEKIL